MSDTKENKPICDIFLFRYFWLSFFRQTKVSNEEMLEILNEFSVYMREKLPPEKIAEFTPKSHLEVMSLTNHPFYTKGFNPGFVLHFTEFVKQEATK